MLETIYEGDLLDEEAAEEYTDTLHSIRFSAMSPGIKNPNVFDVPSICSDATNGTLPSVIGDVLQWHRFAYL